ncbi:MAG: hypothetical protein COU26_03620 [Candidatus Levybacteria bacterium CG10_big_fil_rev_8_21_14_0_10_36_30]|nr:MAG: hypothetical protein COU26_03620 [Candidatus Levybacteria bacterium CG10_big_fil_rev_8_21_14_0_10_36_30]
MINLNDYTDFFLFAGALTIVGSIIYLFFRRNFQNIFISDEEISGLKMKSHESIPQIQQLTVDSPALLKKLPIVLLIIIILGFIFNQFLTWRTGLL